MLRTVPSVIQSELTALLNTALVSFSITSGGCINNGGKLETEFNHFFLKWNNAVRYPGMFEAEAKGLKQLSDPGVIHVPQVITHGVAAEFQFLVLEFVEPKPKQTNYWDLLGEQLANLHRVTSTSFGLDHDNYIGSLPQRNVPSLDWIDFFIQQRLEPQLRTAVDSKKLSTSISNQFESLYQKLPSLLPQEKPSLIHGDLWSGNLITNSEGKPCIIDPAVYFGNREVELAFTELFGGFSERFYEAYDANFKLVPGYHQRAELYQLYPLLVHVNLFGGGYVSHVVSTLQKFV